MKKVLIFIAGVVVGIILTCVAAYMYTQGQRVEENNNLVYHETPKSYENKKTAKFKVFQVFDDAALANESSGYDMFLGTTVLLLGEEFYTDQVVEIKNPQIIGTYSYVTKSERPLKVPVIAEPRK